MAKTKPIGVRFDEELLSDLKLSPQKTLNYLTEYFYAPPKKQPIDTTPKEILEKNSFEGIVPILEKSNHVIFSHPTVEEVESLLHNQEIENQIAEVKTEAKPSMIGKIQFEKYKENKINNLKKQLK